MEKNVGSDKIMSFYHYWGKARPVTENIDQPPYHLLVYHCLDVAAVGQQLLLHDPALAEKIIPKKILEGSPEQKQWFVGVISFLLALHDIGKFSDRFQILRPDIMEELRGYSNTRPYVHHTAMGRIFFDKILWQTIWTKNWFNLDQSDNPVDWQDICEPWFYAVTGHHGFPPQKPDNLLLDLFTHDNQRSAIQFAEACAGLFLHEGPSWFQMNYRQDLLEYSRSSWLLAGLAVLSDWIGSNKISFSYHTEVMPLETYWKDYAIPQAEKAVGSFGVLPVGVSQETGMHMLFPSLIMPTPLQTFAESCVIPHQPQLFIIEEATGSGKTESALVLTHRMMALGLGEGFYFGLPSMATANAMYERMGQPFKKLFSTDSISSLVLAHSARKLSKTFQQSIGYSQKADAEHTIPGEMSTSAQCTAWLADNRKKALLAQGGVGTIDQALMAVLPLHHQSLRLLGLSRNILIVDEVHAYDSYVEKVLETLLEFHAALGGSAILISATLPQAQRQALLSAYSAGLGQTCDHVKQSGYPLVTRVIYGIEKPEEIPIERCEMTHRTIDVECIDDDSVVMNYLSGIIEEEKCACWIRNTVDDAIETYQILSNKFGMDHVLLFHARFTMGDRIRTEQEILKLFGKDSTPELRRGKILVATQVVEQSLDLDFDFMVSDLAPMDLIIQRSGRLHRHKRESRGAPKMVIRIPVFSLKPCYDWYSARFPKGAYVYENHGQLWITAKILIERKKITMPDDARLLIEGTFGEPAQNQIPKSLMDHEIKSDGKKMANVANAQLNILHLNDGYKVTPNQWQDDTRTPTRLGEAKVTLLLLKWENLQLNFFVSDSEYAAELSQVSISEAKISAEFPYSGNLGNALEIFKSGLPDKGKWRICIPLVKHENEWYGEARDKNEKNITVKYDSKLGFRTIKS